MRLFVQRLVSFALMAGGWVLTSLRFILEAIGYSTAPDDAGVAMTLLERFILWLLSVPWWAVLGGALISTAWLMWVSWPSTTVVVAEKERPLQDRLREHRRDIRNKLESSGGTLVRFELSSYNGICPVQYDNKKYHLSFGPRSALSVYVYSGRGDVDRVARIREASSGELIYTNKLDFTSWAYHVNIGERALFRMDDGKCVQIILIEVHEEDAGDPDNQIIFKYLFHERIDDCFNAI